jgi:hypothetical protein
LHILRALSDESAGFLPVRSTQRRVEQPRPELSLDPPLEPVQDISDKASGGPGQHRFSVDSRQVTPFSSVVTVTKL